MTTTNNHKSRPAAFPVSTIIKAGLFAGVLDICFAFLYSYIKGVPKPESILQYISKVAWGKTTLTNPTALIISGLAIHFLIAMGWSILFFILYRRLKMMRQNKIITGIVYGLFVWTIMNILVLPLWNHKPYVFKPETAISNALILIVAIGLPLSFIAHRHYYKKENSTL